MFVYSKTVFIGTDDAKKNYDVAALDAALSSGKEHGPCLVVVEISKGKDGKPNGYNLVGTAVGCHEEDFADSAEIDARLAKDIPAIRKGDEDMGFKPGDAATLLYAVNHDGLPLLYNKAFRAEFTKEGKGRVSATQAVANYMVAVQWCKENQPELVDDMFSAAGQAAINAAYASRQI